MTKREAAIITAYTGILIGKFNDFHKYIEEKAGRGVYTHWLQRIIKAGFFKHYNNWGAIKWI